MDLEQKTFVLGVGAQKAGTSWVRDYLCNRGDVYFSPTEMHFFDSRFGPDTTRRTNRLLTKRNADRQRMGALLRLKLDYLEQRDGENSYREFFRARVPENVRVFGEITPSYALIGEAGYRAVLDVFPNAKIFFIMRDPVERFYSHMRMNRDRHGKDATSSFHHRLIQRVKSDRRSLYETTIHDLERVFSQENILYLFYEQLFGPEAVGRLCTFLGVPYVPADFARAVNAGGPRDDIPEDLDRSVRTFLEATYGFCKEKFGDALPSEWRCR